VIQVYIAAPFPRYRDALAARTALDRAGIRSTARWIDRAATLTGHDALTTAVAEKAIEENDADLRSADALVALCFKREGCEQWGEVARAIEWRKRVALVVSGPSWPLVAYRRGVTVCCDVASAAACFVKQLSRPGKPRGVSHDPLEWPADLRVRQFPKT
jgi:hypothetical protein